MAAPTFVAVSAIGAVANGVQNFTLTLPSHQADDILLMMVACRATTGTFTTPAGWTVVRSWTDGVSSHKYVLYGLRAASGAETNPLVDRSNTSGDMFALAVSYRGCITSETAWEVVGTNSNGTADPLTVTGITTLTADSLVVVAGAYVDNNQTVSTVTATDPASLTVHQAASATGADGMVYFAEGARSAAGATGNLTVDFSGALTAGDGVTGVAIALKPVPVVADRQAIVTWAELQVPTAPRRAIVTQAELSIPDAARRAVVTFAELSAPDAPRRAIVTFAELSAPDAPRRALVTWAELQTPDGARRAVVTHAEMEVPTAPRRALVTFAELSVPDAPSTDRRALVTWAELQTPDAARRAVVTFAELSTPDGARRALVSFAEMSVPDGARRAVITFAELSVPDPTIIDRRALVTWAELSVPDRRGGGGGFRRILYDPAGAQEEIEEEREAQPDEVPEIHPLPEPGPLPAPRNTEPTKPLRLPKKRQIEARVEIVDDDDEIDFILNVVLDLD